MTDQSTTLNVALEQLRQIASISPNSLAKMSLAMRCELTALGASPSQDDRAMAKHSALTAEQFAFIRAKNESNKKIIAGISPDELRIITLLVGSDTDKIVERYLFSRKLQSERDARAKEGR